MKELVKEAMFQHLLDVANVNALTREERIQYEADLKHYRDYVNSLEYAEDKGRAEGRLAVAKMMKIKGMSFSDISECTGLSEVEIESI